MIFMKVGSAMKPFLASSKSRLSSNGSVAETPLRSSIVYLDGKLPFGSKCPCTGVTAWACAARPSSVKCPANAKTPR